MSLNTVEPSFLCSHPAFPCIIHLLYPQVVKCRPSISDHPLAQVGVQYISGLGWLTGVTGPRPPAVGSRPVHKHRSFDFQSSVTFSFLKLSVKLVLLWRAYASSRPQGLKCFLAMIDNGICPQVYLYKNENQIVCRQNCFVLKSSSLVFIFLCSLEEYLKQQTQISFNPIPFLLIHLFTHINIPSFP